MKKCLAILLTLALAVTFVVSSFATTTTFEDVTSIEGCSALGHSVNDRTSDPWCNGNAATRVYMFRNEFTNSWANDTTNGNPGSTNYIIEETAGGNKCVKLDAAEAWQTDGSQSTGNVVSVDIKPTKVAGFAGVFFYQNPYNLGAAALATTEADYLNTGVGITISKDAKSVIIFANLDTVLTYTVDTGLDLTAEWHTYAGYIESGKITFAFDGKVIGSFDANSLSILDANGEVKATGTSGLYTADPRCGFAFTNKDGNIDILIDNLVNEKFTAVPTEKYVAPPAISIDNNVLTYDAETGAFAENAKISITIGTITNGRTWVGLYDKGETDYSGKYAKYWWCYVKSGNMEAPAEDAALDETYELAFSAPAGITAGEYSIILFKDGAYSPVASVDVTVKAAEKAAEVRSFDSSKDSMAYDEIRVNGAVYANGNEDVIAKKKLIDGSDESIKSITLYGWFGSDQATNEKFGYIIDGGEPVYDEAFATETEEAVKNAKANGVRYTITVDVSALKDGKVHEIEACVLLSDGTVVMLDRNEGGKDRDAYVNYQAPGTAEPVSTADASLVIFVVAAVAVALVVLKKKEF